MKILKYIFIFIIILAISASAVFVVFFEKKVPFTFGSDKSLYNKNFDNSFLSINKLNNFYASANETTYNIENESKTFLNTVSSSFEKTGKDDTLYVKFKVRNINQEGIVIDENIYCYYKEDSKYIVMTNGVITYTSESEWQEGITNAYNTVMPLTYVLGSGSRIISAPSIKNNLEKTTQKGATIYFYSSDSHSKYITSTNMFNESYIKINQKKNVFNEEKVLINILENDYYIDFKK